MIVIQSALYLSILVLVIGTILKTIKISQMPIHLRWDLYPIPHEKGKADYGGSYFEEPDWWTKPRQTSSYDEIKEIGKEIFGIKSLFRNNRGLWYLSYPFHVGLYLLTGLIIFLVLGAILQLSGIEITGQSPNIIGRLIYQITIPVGALGWILGAFGAFGLLVMRITTGKYRKYSTRADYFNLILLLSLLVSGLYAWLIVDKSFSALRIFTQDLLLFKFFNGLGLPIKIELGLTALFFFYLPFTQMTHFVGKFFSFHSVRWQDRPSHKGSGVEEDVIDALGERLTWSAPHMQQGKTWAEAASENPDKDDNR